MLNKYIVGTVFFLFCCAGTAHAQAGATNDGIYANMVSAYDCDYPMYIIGSDGPVKLNTGRNEIPVNGGNIRYYCGNDRNTEDTLQCPSETNFVDIKYLMTFGHSSYTYGYNAYIKCYAPIPYHDNWGLGDIFYRYQGICNQRDVNKFWWDFDFDKSDWDDGFGYYSPCDIDRPLNRTFSALWLLLYSSPYPAMSTDDFRGSFLRWAYNYAAREIDELDGRYINSIRNDFIAYTYRNARIELYHGFFYSASIPERAGTIVHEARHADGRRHDNCICPREASCDSRWQDMGANTYGIYYLWWFIDSGINTTTAMKHRALDRANDILRDGFCTPTSFRIPADAMR